MSDRLTHETASGSSAREEPAGATLFNIRPWLEGKTPPRERYPWTAGRAEIVIEAVE